MTDEEVLVVPRASVIPGETWRGVRPGDPTEILATIGREARFAPRAAMEVDPAYKQIIPYLVLRDGERWFLMRRTRAGVDARLHDRYSIGVGGHINPGDHDLAGALRREWDEEVIAGFVPAFAFVGLLNDDETDVGRVHLGVVFAADAAGQPVSIRETDKLEGAFATREELDGVYERMESWSQLVVDFILASRPGDASARA